AMNPMFEFWNWTHSHAITSRVTQAKTVDNAIGPEQYKSPLFTKAEHARLQGRYQDAIDAYSLALCFDFEWAPHILALRSWSYLMLK
ncbi:hypothetical protein AAVH_40990, partial [Aphelenchoides avenae]